MDRDALQRSGGLGALLEQLTWCAGRLWVANTLFYGLVTIEGDWNFVPQWKPQFISCWSACDRCDEPSWYRQLMSGPPVATE